MHGWTAVAINGYAHITSCVLFSFIADRGWHSGVKKKHRFETYFVRPSYFEEPQSHARCGFPTVGTKMACAHDQMEDSARTTHVMCGDSVAVSAIIKTAKDKDLLKEFTQQIVSQEVMESLLGRSPSPHGKTEHCTTTREKIDASSENANERLSVSPLSESSHKPNAVTVSSPVLVKRTGIDNDALSSRVIEGDLNSGVTVKKPTPSPAQDDPDCTGSEQGKRAPSEMGNEPPIHELKFENEVLRQQLLHAKVARSDLEKENEVLKEMLEQHAGTHSPSLSRFSIIPDKTPTTINSPKLKPVPLPRKIVEKQSSLEYTKQLKVDVRQNGASESGMSTSFTNSCTLQSNGDEPVPVKPPRRKNAGQTPSSKPPLPPYPPRAKLDGSTKPLPDKGSVPSQQSPRLPSAQSPRQRQHLSLVVSQSSVPSPGTNYRTTHIKHDSSWIVSRNSPAMPTARTTECPSVDSNTVPCAPESHSSEISPTTIKTGPTNSPSSSNGTPLRNDVKTKSIDVLQASHAEKQPGDLSKSKAQKSRKFSFLRRQHPPILPKTEGTPEEAMMSKQRNGNGTPLSDSAQTRLLESLDHERQRRPSSVADNAPSYKSRKLSSQNSTAILKGSGISTPVMPSTESWQDQHKTLEDIDDSGFDGDDGSDDEKGGTLKIIPKLKSVPERKITSLDEDTEPESAQLFEYVFVVSLKSGEKGSAPTPQITYSFPPAISFTGKDAALSALPNFCFPDIVHLKPCTNYRSETFSFILTDIEGTRRYGYCRRLLPSGTEPRLPEVYCIVSSYGCFSLYEHILDHVEQKRAVSAASVFTFLQAIRANRFPKPGKTVSVKCIDIKAGGMETVEFSRPLDSRLEHVDFSILFTTLSSRKIIKLVSAILMERRIVLCADSLTRLSSCAHAVMALIYPFVWQHALIPVLPSDLVDFCCSPLPFLMGILPTCLKKMDELEMEEDVLIVDLDKNKFIRQVGDEENILPSKLFKYLDSVLGSPSVKSEYQKPAAKRTEQSRADEIVVNSFMMIFTYLYGNYKEYIGIVEQGSFNSTFKAEEFLQSFKSKSTKRFLEAFQKTQMFDHFIAERENPNTAEVVSKGLFDTRLTELKSRLQEIEIFSSSKKRWRPFGKKK